MTRIKDEQQYKVTSQRVEELLKLVSNEEDASATVLNELDLLGNLVADYEEEHYPVVIPSLSDSLKYKMAEMNLTQDALAEILGVSQSHVNKFLTGKSEPTLKVARTIRKTLNIDADIILGIS